MEKKVSAFVIKTIDYKDDDKLVTLFTASGKITAALRGVKKAKAKLKIFAQPFCFAEFLLAEKAGRHTVTGGDIIDAFYSLWTDTYKFYAASSALELVNVFGGENQPSEDVFLTTLNLFRNLAYEKTDTSVMLIKYITDILKLSGYGLYFGEKLSGSVPGLIEAVSALPVEKLIGQRADPAESKAAIRYLKAFAEEKADCSFKTLGEFLNILSTAG